MNNPERKAAIAKRYEFSNTLESLRPDEDEPREPMSPAAKNFLIVATLFVVIFGWVAYVETNPGRSARQNSVTADPLKNAFYGAQQHVAAKLKAPRTAKFCSWSDCDVVTDKEGKRYVRGWVDSQNSFGAMIRSEWRVGMNENFVLTGPVVIH
jgi:hypothetical protein